MHQGLYNLNLANKVSLEVDGASDLGPYPGLEWFEFGFLMDSSIWKKAN